MKNSRKSKNLRALRKSLAHFFLEPSGQSRRADCTSERSAEALRFGAGAPGFAVIVATRAFAEPNSVTLW